MLDGLIAGLASHNLRHFDVSRPCVVLDQFLHSLLLILILPTEQFLIFFEVAFKCLDRAQLMVVSFPRSYKSICKQINKIKNQKTHKIVM